MNPMTTVECPAARARLYRVSEWRRFMAFSVTSSSFKDGDYLPKDFILSADFGFGCAGGNKSPHLKWSDAPAGTKSFAVTCYDPDAPTGSGFWHPHRYLFTVFAVKADKLDVKADTSAAVVGFNLHFNTLAKAAIMGLFKR